MIHPVPKPEKAVKLKGKAYTEFRKQVYEREKGICQDCGKFAPRLVNGVFDWLLCGHVAHIERREIGGDVLENAKWKCFDCHIGKEHTKGIQ